MHWCLDERGDAVIETRVFCICLEQLSDERRLFPLKPSDKLRLLPHLLQDYTTELVGMFLKVHIHIHRVS